MKYTLTTYKVDLEVCDVGEPARTSEDAYRIAKGIYETLDADKEHFVLLGLTIKNRIKSHKVLGTGTLTASLVTPAEVFTAVLRLRAPAIICVHNHPSGDPAPSLEDQDITRRLKESSEILAIRLLDHIILGHDRYFSFSDRGLL